MTQDTALVDAFHQVFGVPTYRLQRDISPAAFEDEETLRRSRHGLIAAPTVVRRNADLPVEPWLDDLAVALGQPPP